MKGTADYDFSASNEELLGLCKRQDQEGLRVLFRRHERPIYSLLYRMLSSHEDAEEALADVFVKVWRAAASFKGESKFTTWLYRIAANTARDYLRSRMTRQEVSIEEISPNGIERLEGTGSNTNDPQRALIDAERRSSMIKALSGLSEEDRLIVSLYHLQGMDYDDVAGITGIPPGNLKVKLFRARQRLRRLCAAQEKEGGENEVQPGTSESSGLQQGAAEWA